MLDSCVDLIHLDFDTLPDIEILFSPVTLKFASAAGSDYKTWSKIHVVANESMINAPVL